MRVHLLLAVLPCFVLADLEIFTQRYSADPSPYVAGGRMYITTSHDRASDTSWSMRDYNCLSSDDLVNWRDEGTRATTRLTGALKCRTSVCPSRRDCLLDGLRILGAFGASSLQHRQRSTRHPLFRDRHPLFRDRVASPQAWAQQVVELPNGTFLMAYPGMGGAFDWPYPVRSQTGSKDRRTCALHDLGSHGWAHPSRC
jgi:peptidoglycan/xylan/chitin deacetylase (PgdA/CDA1 family)